MATHSSITAWRIPWTDEPGGLQSMGLQGVRHDSVDQKKTQFHISQAEIPKTWASCLLISVVT